jgi:hypothetical protein
MSNKTLSSNPLLFFAERNRDQPSENKLFTQSCFSKGANDPQSQSGRVSKAGREGTSWNVDHREGSRCPA